MTTEAKYRVTIHKQGQQAPRSVWPPQGSNAFQWQTKPQDDAQRPLSAHERAKAYQRNYYHSKVKAAALRDNTNNPFCPPTPTQADRDRNAVIKGKPL